MPEGQETKVSVEFEGVVRAHSALVLTLALRITGDAATAQDVSQEVFLAVWRTFGRERREMNWPAYLRAATVREAIRQMKAKRPSEPGALERVEDAKTVSPEGGASAAELRSAVRVGLTRLPESQALAFALVKLDGLSYRECAAVMGCSESAARVHAHRAAQALARMLRAYATRARGNLLTEEGGRK